MIIGNWIVLDVWKGSTPGDVSWNCRCKVCGFEGPISDRVLCGQSIGCPVCEGDDSERAKRARRRRIGSNPAIMKRRLKHMLGLPARENKMDGDGYIRVYAPDHPRVMADGYVLEHRLLLEEHLGRYLTEKETVNHRNGIRSQNQIGNLELWASRHPRGQRVVDLVSWAHELLNEYGGEDDPSDR